MPFVPRVFDTILADMIAHVRANTTLTDFTVGSVIRTILEAAALEDDEQYFQMVQLLQAFSFQTATGDDLDNRVADFNIVRLVAATATGYVRFRNGALTRDTLAFNTVATQTTLQLNDSSEFPTSYPYDIRVGEGTGQVEDVTVSNNDTVSNTLTVSATANDHSIGDRVAVITGMADQEVASGTQVQVPAQGSNLAIIFQSGEKGTIVAGNYESALVGIISSNSGASNNVGASQITQFVSAPPFTGAAVYNPSATGGGRDRETDAELRDRARLRLQELSRGTPVAVESAVRGLEDTDTGQRVVTSQLVENFITDEHLLYIDDGTGFTPSRVAMAQSTVNGLHGVGVAAIAVNDPAEFPPSGWILVSPNDPLQVELLEYTSKTVANLDLAGLTARQHDNSDVVYLVDVLTPAEEGQNYFRLSNYPVQDNSFTILDNSTGEYLFKTEGTDYFLNRTNGWMQYYGAGLPSGAQVLANYTYYTGLVQLAQKTLNGDPDNSTLYPGVVAGGIIIQVTTPTIRQISIGLAVTVGVGYEAEDVKSDVQLFEEVYVNSLGIGANVIVAKIIERAMDIEGVDNVEVLYPDSDVVILEEELPRAFDSSGNSLVTVL